MAQSNFNKSDIVDFVERNPNVDLKLVLKRLADETPVWKPDTKKTPEDASGSTNGVSGDRKGVSPELVFKTASKITVQPVRWLWPHILAEGKITLLAGDPGTGKSTVTASIAAIVSNGKVWPLSNGGPVLPGEVLLFSAEDSAEDTIVPRLMAADGVLDRVHIFETVKAGDKESGFDLVSGLYLLKKALNDIPGVRLLIVDPISSFLGECDSHNNSEVRAALAPLSKLAEDYSVSVLLVSHLNKSRFSNPLYAVTGSLAFTALARVAYLTIKDPEGNGNLFLPVKSNIGLNRDTGLRYRIESAVVSGGVETSGIEWLEPLGGEAGDYFGKEKHEPSAARSEAIEFLETELAGGPKPSSDIQTSAKELGISKNSLDGARRNLGVISKKDGFQGRWIWELPLVQTGGL